MTPFYCLIHFYKRAPTWHFRGVASSLLGPHQTGARVTTLNLTPPHPPMTDPMNPLTLLETIAPAGDFRAVWRAPSRAHTRASWLSRPTLVSQPIPSLPEAKPRDQTRSPGAAAAAAVCVILAMSGGPPLLSVDTPDSPSTMMMEEEKEKEVTYCLDQYVPCDQTR